MSEVEIRNFLRSGVATGWWMAGGFGAELVVAVLALALFGVGERGTDIALQLTARLSFVLFLPAYAAGALTTLFGPPFDLLKARAREFGLSFAAAQLVHLGVVVWLCLIGDTPGVATFVLFGTAAAWLYVLALLSIDRLHRAVGHAAWKWLQLVGMNFIALAFAVDLLRIPFEATAEFLVGYLPFDALIIAAPVLRIAAWIYQTRRTAGAVRT